ncbi:hypothetical protein EYZ11_007638 [Aspergillus tanneri]|uniref:LysM domain-containing protein n=1 Tax=Aspergillus tanneri TaxID=1220188 RepID=A0A4S3JCH5_9EURO|nr:uncharacterized protein ATNIH1004_011473 [Aspergillus tanneri]KAA8642528.1 hypothetical protein ATNIH1004_011473 [Aspergillus tanneri]THC92886.1 hypothetical protein EYZ11_007638 [Aspergillus tanneri]
MPYTSLWITASAVLCLIIAFSTPVSTLGAQSNSLVATLNHPDVFQSQLQPCPEACASHRSQDWTVYPSFDRLSFCHKPILFNFAIHTSVNDSSKTLKFRACTAGDGWNKKTSNALAIGDSVYNSTNDHGLNALTQVQAYLHAGADCTKNIMLGYYNSTVVGVYVGEALCKATASSAIDRLLSQVKRAVPATMLMQLCSDQCDADHVFGIAVSPIADLVAVQAALVSWSKGKCESRLGDATSLPDVSIWEVPQRSVGRNTTISNSTAQELDTPPGKRLLARAAKYCTKRKVVSGDTCQSLAKICGITLDQFYKYNSKDMCSRLQIGSSVCCTDGFLKPQPYNNGTCYIYTTRSGDTCYDIGLAQSLTVDNLNKFNNGTTWGWNGCDNLGAGQNICLSLGNPPMPAVLPSSVCGPQVPGTEVDEPITDASKLAMLNPCPLNSCCNIWGQCGIDSSFCTKSKGPTGNPGTSKPGVFGCTSNCGTDIVNNDKGPSDGYQRVGYYETYSWDRKCLRL